MCPAGSRGPGGPGLKLGGGLSKSPANIATPTTVTGQREAGAPFIFSAKAFPLSGAENGSCTTGVCEGRRLGAPNMLPQTQTNNPTGQLSFWGHLGLGAQG